MSELDVFKNNEPGDTIYVVTDDVEAKKLLAMWPFLWKHNPTYPKGTPPDDTNDRWEWVWQNIHPDADVMAARSGVPKHTVLEKFELLKCAHLIYPDGTTSQWAQRLLRTEMSNRYAPKRREK